MNTSQALSPFTFFFILYCHITAFCFVCVYYVDKWLLDEFYANVICQWTGKVGIGLTVVTVLSGICTILMSTISKIKGKILPIINFILTLSMIALTFVIGIRTRTGFVTDYSTYINKKGNPEFANFYSAFNLQTCPSGTPEQTCQRNVHIYLWNRSAAIGSYILALLLIFACIQMALTARCLFYGPICGRKATET
ncbi:hypothetical protein TRFO_41049 [Tritrichomonas foetus]|uniref:Uncharacterized protein n=1 Tax=Tritrichomonas foetus TaxID=1144522 RepID=A0A1J4L1I3_9EUKA|nr:hypothetical protein TRFO_41049 [Tritrichomonas foetus]|eukprot:OHT17377.1 hypothetical protein TRFO_41049 [Tritrichomonas foetus]